MKLKFCGLTRKADIEAANETKPDFIGFVFAESRRHVSDMDAARLKEHLDPEIKAGRRVRERRAGAHRRAGAR